MAYFRDLIVPDPAPERQPRGGDGCQGSGFRPGGAGGADGGWRVADLALDGSGDAGARDTGVQREGESQAFS